MKTAPAFPVRLLLAACLLGCGAAAQAQSVALTGVIGGKAIVMVNGGAPKTVATGETWQGVKVISVAGDQAVLESSGQRYTVRMGDAPASFGGTAPATSGSRIVLPLGSGGHFMAQGSINGRPTQFMVDTGATAVSMGAAEAERLGLDYKGGKPVQLSTANGPALGYRMQLNSVRINDVEIFTVDAVVTPMAMPFVLLGNSFLSRFTMRRDGDQMVLDKRY